MASGVRFYFSLFLADHREELNPGSRIFVMIQLLISALNLKTDMITFRPVNTGDLPLLQHWDQQPHVIAANPNDDWEWEKELRHSPEWREQLIAEADGRPVGFVQIIDPALEETHYWGETGEGFRAIDIWIGEASDLGKGYGTAMMKQAVDRCFSDPGVTAILVDPLAANTGSHRFYERLGFRFVEERRFGKDHCFVYRLDTCKVSGKMTGESSGESP